MIDDTTSFTGDIEMSTTWEWCCDEYVGCFTILIYGFLRNHPEEIISTRKIPRDIEECFIDRFFGCLYSFFCDRNNTKKIFSWVKWLRIDSKRRILYISRSYCGIYTMCYWGLLSSQGWDFLRCIRPMYELISIFSLERCIPFSIFWFYCSLEWFSRVDDPLCESWF